MQPGTPVQNDARREINAPPPVVHVWRTHLDLAPAELAAAWHTLSDDERRRAQRFRSPTLAGRFAASRGFVRAVLGWYLGRSPNELQFVYAAEGKPRVELSTEGPTREGPTREGPTREGPTREGPTREGPTVESPALEFNLSHAEDVALLAVTVTRQVGIDLERIDPGRADALGPAVLTERERRALATLPAPRHLAALFRLWTRKEAVLKAAGLGLSYPPAELDVRPESDRMPLVLRFPAGPLRKTVWTVYDIRDLDGYAGAVAMEGPPTVPPRGPMEWRAGARMPSRSDQAVWLPTP